MWEDYAKAHGITTAQMTQAQKIEAEYNGIMQETRFQVGDATAYTKTFGGQMQQLKFNFNQMTVAIGKVVTPLAQLFIPAINVAISAVTSFFNTIGQFLKVFGLDFPNVVSKAGSSMANLGSSAVDTASDIASTGSAAKKAAKEVNKAFAGVDEINVLSSNKNSSSDDSSAGSGTSTGSVSAPIVPTIETVDDGAVSTAVQATVEKIKKFFEPLQNISFDNLTNAFGNLISALGEFGSGVFQGLSDFYFTLLVPLAQWTIEDALPKFLNSTADAISGIDFTSINKSFHNLWEAIKPFGKKVGDGLLWFYEKVMLPVAKWTINNILPGFLNGLSGALKIANQVLSDIQPIFDWFWNSILQPIASWTGGIIVDVINGIGDALNWISQNEIAITLLESLATAIGLVAGALEIWNVGVGIWNSIGPVATAVTSAFGVAMKVLTNPITLTIAAITAVIAIVVLLIKHWDDVCAAASACWDWVVSVFKGAADWFNNTLVKPVVNFFSGLWNGLKDGAKNAWNGIKNIFSSVASFFKDIFSNAWNAVKNVFSTGGKIFSGIVDGIISAFKAVVNVIIDGINKVVALPFNGLNGILNTISNLSILGVEPFSWLTWRAPVPQIPHLAQGDWVPANNPQLAIIGDNKREPEIVSPESKIYDQVIKAIKDVGLANNNGTNNLEITLKVLYEDGKTIIQKINREQINAGQVLLIS